MKRFHAFAITGLAVLGLFTGACDRRAPTADTQGRGYTPSSDPNTAATPNDNRQPVAGHEPAGTPAPPSTTTTPMPATPTDTAPAATTTPMTASPDVYWVTDDGRRTAIDDSTMVTRIQQKLTEAGVYSGPTDGHVSADLEGAIRQFQAKRGLAENGMIDSRTATALNIEWDKVNAAGSDLKAGAKELGKDLKDDAKKAGAEVKQGAKDVKDFVDDKTKEAR